jgi:hypothetical protein
MMTIYNGEVTLDSFGEAEVELPSWFEALNQDFRYQLTAIGAPAPNLHVAKTIQGNRFRIAGGSPGLVVSWQVTGVRHDVYAEAHRIPVEAWKPEIKQPRAAAQIDGDIRLRCHRPPIRLCLGLLSDLPPDSPDRE